MVRAMFRPLAAAALLCSLNLLACGDDSSANDKTGSGGSSSDTQTSADDSGSSTGAPTTTDPTSAESGGLPLDCVGQQGEGPCMIETVVMLPSPEVAYGDFDGDGDVDVLARSEETGVDGADEVLLFANDGGDFGEGTALSFGTDPAANGLFVALSRPRPMGAPAAAVRSAFLQGTYGALGDIQVDAWWVQDGALERFYDPTPTPPAGPWFGDFDGDGSADLAFAPDDTDLAALELHACTGASCGDASDAAATGAPGGPWTILGTDTTGDGLDELLVVRREGESLEVVVLTNDGTDFAATSTLALGTDLAPASARLADVDADGRNDLVLTSTGEPTSNSYGSTLSVFTQDGNGGLQVGPVIEAGDRITGYAFADFDADGTPDIGLRRTDLAVINVGLGPAFDSGVSYDLSAEPTGIEGQAIPSWETDILDLDGDGDLDVLTVTAQEGQEAYALNVLIAH